MIFFVHILFGAIIAAKAKNPFLIPVFALLSHYILDAIPHNDYSVENLEKRRWKKAGVEITKVLMDIALGFFFIILAHSITETSYFLLLLGSLFAMLPDLAVVVNGRLPNNRFFIEHKRFHNRIHTLIDPDPELCPGSAKTRHAGTRKKFSFWEKILILYVLLLFALGIVL